MEGPADAADETMDAHALQPVVMDPSASAAPADPEATIPSAAGGNAGAIENEAQSNRVAGTPPQAVPPVEEAGVHVFEEGGAVRSEDAAGETDSQTLEPQAAINELPDGAPGAAPAEGEAPAMETIPTEVQHESDVAPGATGGEIINSNPTDSSLDSHEAPAEDAAAAPADRAADAPEEGIPEAASVEDPRAASSDASLVERPQAGGPDVPASAEDPEGTTPSADGGVNGAQHAPATAPPAAEDEEGLSEEDAVAPPVVAAADDAGTLPPSVAPVEDGAVLAADEGAVVRSQDVGSETADSQAPEPAVVDSFVAAAAGADDASLAEGGLPESLPERGADHPADADAALAERGAAREGSSSGSPQPPRADAAAAEEEAEEAGEAGEAGEVALETEAAGDGAAATSVEYETAPGGEGAETPAKEERAVVVKKEEERVVEEEEERVVERTTVKSLGGQQEVERVVKVPGQGARGAQRLLV